jgi:hypothetical protein
VAPGFPESSAAVGWRLAQGIILLTATAAGSLIVVMRAV